MEVNNCSYWRPKVNDKFYSLWSNSFGKTQPHWQWSKILKIMVWRMQTWKYWTKILKISESHISATSATMYLPIQAIWGHIWKSTVEKGQTNVIYVTLRLLRQAICGDIWKYTVGKSQTNATNVTLHHLMQALWGDIWKRTVEKRQTNAANVTLHHLMQALWGDI